MDKGVRIGPATGNVEDMTTFEQFYDAYKKQMDYAIQLLVNADNAIDMAHAERCPLPFLSSMVDDCMKVGKTVQEGGAVYNFTGPQGFGVANMADSLYSVKTLVYDEKKITMGELKEALATNFGKGLGAEDVAAMTAKIANELKEAGKTIGEKEVAAILNTVVAASEAPEVKVNGERILKLIEEVPKFGNDIPEVDAFARDVAYTYTEPLQNYKIREAVPSRRGFIRYPPMYRSAHRRERLRMDVWHISRWPMVCLRLQEKMSMVRQRLRTLFPDWIITLHRTVPYLIRNSILLHSAEEMDWRTL